MTGQQARDLAMRQIEAANRAMDTEQQSVLFAEAKEWLLIALDLEGQLIAGTPEQTLAFRRTAAEAIVAARRRSGTTARSQSRWTRDSIAAK